MPKSWNFLFCLIVLCVWQVASAEESIRTADDIVGPIDESELQQIETERVELYGGGGFYSFRPNNTGYFVWGKPRLNLLHFKGERLKLGVYFRGALGNGENSDEFQYDWNELEGGISARKYWRGGDDTLDVGFGRHSDNGHLDLDNGQYSSDQAGWYWSFSNNIAFYQRRERREVWFPKWETNVELVKKVGSGRFCEEWDDKDNPELSWSGENPDSESQGKAADFSRWSLQGIVWVYDAWTKSPKLHFTPGISASLGEEGNNLSFGKAGIALDVGTQSYSFANFSLERKFGEKESGWIVSSWASYRF